MVDNWRFRFPSLKLIFDLVACIDRMYFGIYLSAKNQVARVVCLLSPVATDGMDGKGLKFEKKLANFFEF